MSDVRGETKKILVLNGSPRRGASSTMQVTSAFVGGMQSAADCAAETLNVRDLSIKPCTGCLSCWGRTEGECVIKDDDASAVKAKIEEADVVIQSYPLYFFGMPGEMKTLTDRMLGMMCTYRGQNPPEDGRSFHGIRRPRPGRRFVVVASCAYTDSAAVFEPLLKQYDCICGKGNYLPILCPQIFTLFKLDGEGRKKRYLNKFYEAGRQFAVSGTLSEETLADLSKPPFSAETYRVLLEKFWENEKKGEK